MKHACTFERAIKWCWVERLQTPGIGNNENGWADNFMDTAVVMLCVAAARRGGGVMCAMVSRLWVCVTFIYHVCIMTVVHESSLCCKGLWKMGNVNGITAQPAAPAATATNHLPDYAPTCTCTQQPRHCSQHVYVIILPCYQMRSSQHQHKVNRTLPSCPHIATQFMQKTLQQRFTYCYCSLQAILTAPQR